MMDKTFNRCVDLLEWLADKLNILYEELNVIIFVIGYPILLASLGIIYTLK